MAPILPFLRDESTFDPDATHAMSVAFDEVCVALGLPEGNGPEREEIASRIIEFARRGERDADRIRDHVLQEARSPGGEPDEAAPKWRGTA